MKDRANVLIYPAGSENAMEVYYSLKYNIHFTVFGATRVSNHAEYIYPEGRLYFGNLTISDESVVDELNSVVEQFQIDFIIPTHDTIALFLMEHQADIHAQIICSPYETAKLAENKKLMFEALAECPFVPRVYQNPEQIEQYPVFLKPYIGTGGRGTFLANNRSELEEILLKQSDLLICEYLPGREYTVDCFTNKKGELLFAGPRTRERIINGMAHRCERVEDSREFKKIARELNDKLVLCGAWFFQVKEDGNENLKLMEFSVRQAGTMAFFRQLGVNFAALSLLDAMGYDVKVLFNDYRLILDRCLEAGYRLDYKYDRLYVDFDHTLIVEDKVNTVLMKLIYQCINKKKKVILLTKHVLDLDESLKKYRIDKALFDEIILLREEDSKANYIAKANAVFVDNRFPERELVRKICSIPVFDVDAAGCLIDTADV